MLGILVCSAAALVALALLAWFAWYDGDRG